MDNKKVKKVVVEFEDGNKLEYTGDVVMFVEDEMSAAEKLFEGNSRRKLWGVVQCSSGFLAAAANSVLDTLAENNSGLDIAVMLKHLDDVKANRMTDVLENIFG